MDIHNGTTRDTGKILDDPVWSATPEHRPLDVHGMPAQLR